MKKQVKVLATAALLAMGATMTSFAAEKGTWDLVDGEWVCYDEDGDLYENEWCLSNGVEYYVGDDGIMVTNDWVEDGTYFVNSAGQKVINEWRLVAPYEDEEADEEWFYFGSKGKKVTADKKVINGNTYYFDNDGVMLTGWVDKNNYEEAETMSGAVYTDENGARVKNSWIKTYAPGVDEDEDDVDEDDMNWYYIGSKGAAKTGKVSNINGATYFFDEEGVMLSGWVAASGSNYVEIGTEDAAANKDVISNYSEVYFCGDEDDGHAKKNTWVKEWKNTQYDAADSDNSKKWFWIAKDGKVFVPGETETTATEVTFEDGEATEKYSYDDLGSVEEKKINGETYLFNKNGEMLSGLVIIDGNTYYYGGSSDGAKKDGSQTIEDECGVAYKFYFSTEDKTEQGYYDNAGVTGAKGGKLYENGLLVTSEDAKYAVVEVGGVNYIVNKSGSIQTSSKVYKDDDEVVIDAENIEFCKDAGVKKGSF